jgi:hypothetical protein
MLMLFFSMTSTLEGRIFVKSDSRIVGIMRHEIHLYFHGV